MKTKEKIDELSEEFLTFHQEGSKVYHIKIREAIAFAYTKCQEDNDWTKNCECKSSIGQTWCCNQCGLPYDTRKSYKKYTEEDLMSAFNAGINNDYGNGPSFDTWLNSLNKD